jgi:hypothetical protein
MAVYGYGKQSEICIIRWEKNDKGKGEDLPYGLNLNFSVCHHATSLKLF